MEEQLISFKTARLAKEKGFNERTIEVWNTHNSEGLLGEELMDEDLCHWNSYRGGYLTNKEEILYAAPTQSLLQKWLREKYNIHIYIEPIWENNEEARITETRPEYIPWVVYTYIEKDDVPEYYKTYEEALEIALQEALKLI